MEGSLSLRSSWGLGVLVSGALLATPSVAADSVELVGRWVLESIGGVAVAPTADVYFQVDGDRIEGFDGCNRFGGSLTRGTILSGQLGCEGDYVRLPLDLADPATHLQQAVIAGDVLSLSLEDGPGVALFRRAARP